ncbi:uncharacterized protein LACBIDRAFT_301412 [Laccaria bicolor S238N-H82]|uniref:Predicted protein n=1 Tax=Laccaria bicolor (strain S238N-H82 / ATCC MYA-4686) TaxID=486041 RepID=B0CNH4_LACBS|nr:uncharacterized protein LACBIDRAFT_301412 [Laccaria bicolor S238N-H82]EDR15928.1 predicted protein [Laccaria bicolor S238N-H82]|eukprot:XP_001874136.1 predicted protein [Laccaria bicolor S238N-H82]
MPSYGIAPASPTHGFFPSGSSSPNAFGSFYQNPREAHSMYTAFNPSSSSQKPQGQHYQSGKGGLKRFFGL